MEANKTTQVMASTGRLVILLTLFGIALVALAAEPLDDSPWWTEIFYASKAIAVAAFVAFGKLCARWSKTDKWLKAYNDRCDKILDSTTREEGCR